MPKTIIQKVKFKNVSPQALYDTYMDARKHAEAVGSRYVSIQPRVGGHFRAFTQLTGKFLHLEKGKRIVQTWRAKSWKKKDPDSILILAFKKIRGGSEIEMHHVGVADSDYRAISKGWPDYYWKKWRKYLRSESSSSKTERENG